MVIRKIKKKTKYKIYVQRLQNIKLVFFGVFLFALSFIFFKYLSSSNITKMFSHNAEENIIYDIGRDKGKVITIEGYVFPYTYTYDEKEYNFYILITQEGIKYIVGVDKDKFINEAFPTVIDGKIKNFVGPIPYVYATKTQKKDFSSLGTGFLIPKFNKKDREDKIKRIVSFYYTPIIRSIPEGGMDFSSYKGYTMYFPRKVYYEVILIKEDFDIKGLYCDNAVLIVGNDKKRLVNLDKSYIRNNARLKIFVCSFESSPGNKNKIPPQIKGMQYMTVPSKDIHFYIQVVNPIWKSIANEIAVRKKK